jgi:hypothetical protein
VIANWERPVNICFTLSERGFLEGYEKNMKAFQYHVRKDLMHKSISKENIEIGRLFSVDVLSDVLDADVYPGIVHRCCDYALPSARSMQLQRRSVSTWPASRRCRQ